MKPKTLERYIETHGQSETARRAGLTQGAIWQMVKSLRRITVNEDPDGYATLEETKTLNPRIS